MTPTSTTKAGPQILLADHHRSPEEWKRLHRGRISASTAAVVLGLSERRSPLEAWLEITGRVETELTGDRIEAGQYMEDGIARWYAKRFDCELEQSPGLLVDPQRPWLIGTPDFGIVRGGGRANGVLECKNVDRQFKDVWLTEVPNDYFVQWQLYSHLWGREWGAFAVVFGGNELQGYLQYRNDPFLDKLLEALERWYDRHIEKGIEPPVTGTEGSIKAFKRLHPKDNGELCQLDSSEDLKADIRLKEIDVAMKPLEQEREALRAYMMERIGDNTYGVLPDGSGWKFAHQQINHKPKDAWVEDRRVLARVKRVAR